MTDEKRWSLHHGDCLAWLRTLPDESVDAVVTDPPAGIAFMGKAWDGHRGGRAEWVAWLASVMRECLRVLKPGGHALVWSLPRTEHWTACAVEDAGFEIRDGVYHLCSQGWPKSLDVSKAIDKSAGATREVVAPNPNARPNRRGVESHSLSQAQTVGGPLTAPATDDAKRWAGYGSALKPAVEKWILARKPLDGTIAENVLAHGVGALNVDGCRVEAGARPLLSRTSEESDSTAYGYGRGGSLRAGETTLGRWPSNVVLSHAETCGEECDAACPVADLDRQSGTLKSGDNSATRRDGSRGSYGVARRSDSVSSLRGPDEGGASRFFPIFHPFGYFAKAKTASQRGGRENRHPTVKNVDLMRWLVRLITPPRGLVLDAFGGSGTTGVAAMLEGFQFMAAEQDAESYETARARLEAAERGALVVTSTASDTPPSESSDEPAPFVDPRQLALFGGGR